MHYLLFWIISNLHLIRLKDNKRLSLNLPTRLDLFLDSKGYLSNSLLLNEYHPSLPHNNRSYNTQLAKPLVNEKWDWMISISLLFSERVTLVKSCLLKKRWQTICMLSKSWKRNLSLIMMKLRGMWFIKFSIMRWLNHLRSTRSEKRVFLAAARERHPFLLGLHSCFQTETRVYFVMEYVSGGDLMLHIQRKQFTLRQAKFYASEVLLALEYFHANGIVYR